MYVLGQDGKGKLWKLIYFTAKNIDFYLFGYIIDIPLKECTVFSLDPSLAFRLEQILLLLPMSYLMVIFLIILNCDHNLLWILLNHLIILDPSLSIHFLFVSKSGPQDHSVLETSKSSLFAVFSKFNY